MQQCEHQQRLVDAQRQGDLEGESKELTWLSHQFMATKQYSDALPLLQKRLELVESKPLLVQDNVFAAMSALGRCFLGLGRTADSLAVHEQQVKKAEQQGGAEDQIVALIDLGSAGMSSWAISITEDQGVCTEPYITLKKAAALAEATWPENDFGWTDMTSPAEMCKKRQYIAQIHYQLGIWYSNVLQISYRWLYLRQNETGLRSPFPSCFLVKQVEAKRDLVFAGIDAFRQAAQLWRDQNSSVAPSSRQQEALAEALLLEARLLYMQGDVDDAVRTLEESFKIFADRSTLLCSYCRHERKQTSTSESTDSTCGACGVEKYCGKKCQSLAWKAKSAPGTPSDITQFLSHRFVCNALGSYKSINRGKQHSESCREELLKLLHKMANWIPQAENLFWSSTLVAGVTVKVCSPEPSPELYRQGKLTEYVGTLADFKSSQGRWKVQLYSLALTETQTILAEASDLVYLSGPSVNDTEDESWWKSPDEDEDAERLIQRTIEMDLSQREADLPVNSKVGLGSVTGGTSQLKVGDVVKMHSLQTTVYNGRYGTLVEFHADAGRWVVEMQHKKLIRFRASNLTFVRRKKQRTLPGDLEIDKTLSKMKHLSDRQDWKGILAMEAEALLTARALILPTSRRKVAAERCYFYLFDANSKLACHVASTAREKKAHHEKALEMCEQQLAIVQRFGGLLHVSRAKANMATLHLMQQDFSRAFSMLEQARRTFRAFGDKESEVTACYTLATICNMPTVGQEERLEELVETCAQLRAEREAKMSSRSAEMMIMLDQKMREPLTEEERSLEYSMITTAIMDHDSASLEYSMITTAMMSNLNRPPRGRRIMVANLWPSTRELELDCGPRSSKSGPLHGSGFRMPDRKKEHGE
jgi:tetratricopeptide (TPR) repeat protein